MSSGRRFDVEDHYGAHLKKETLRTLSQLFVLTNKAVDTKRKEASRAIRRVERDRIRYRDFVEINELFVDYLTKLKGTASASNFMNKMHTAELTGAIVGVRGKCGIIVEERMNSIIVVFEDDTVKTYLKKTNDFVIEYEGAKYIFIGSKMKINRFVKK